MLTLYFAPGSSSMAPHIALHEVGATFESRPISFARQEQLQPSFLELNPEGKVPVLLVDGRPLTEVAAILYYLARRFPDAGLFPRDDPAREARIVSWMSFIAATLHPARRRGVEALKEVWALAEQRLDGRAWADDSYSIADIHLFRLFWRFENAEPEAARRFPGSFRHFERVMERAAVKRTIELESAIGYELAGWRS
jgi:glutathione S-transferase